MITKIIGTPYHTACNSDNFEEDNSFMLWFTGLTEDESEGQ